MSTTRVSSDNVNAVTSRMNAMHVDRGFSYSAGEQGSDSDSYRMDNRYRGKFILINNKTFEKQTELSEREGTDVDASNLKREFSKPGFKVERYDNQRAIDMLRIIERAGQEDHSECDCIAVAVLSHGDQGVLYGVDATITNEQMVEPIKKCQSLAGKPKLFFFQACRGDELDAGVEVQKDSDQMTSRGYFDRIPLEADFLFAYATTPGHFSWRNSNKGSWFVQALCHVLGDPKYADLEFLHKMTQVNKKVAYDFESDTSKAHMNRKKQSASTIHQLTKYLYLAPKK